LNSAIDSLPVLVINPYSRCNCRCVMCDIWRGTDVHALTRDNLERQLESVADLNVRWIAFSGGDPLMHPNLFELCQAVKRRGIRLTLVTTGLLLERFAHEIIANADDVIVSLDGPGPVHDNIRKVTGAFRSLHDGIAAVHALNAHFAIAARCTVQSRNCGSLVKTVKVAREIGIDSLSFLAVDVHSTAFNRTDPLTVLQQSDLAVGITQIPTLDAEIEAIVDSGDCNAFVVESPAKLRRISHHFRCYWNLARYVAPRCNAPWKSAVLESDGTVRPCFFHAAIGVLKPGTDLRAILESEAAVRFRSDLNVNSNSVCQRCVCSLNWRDKE
jgi:MoaA/NifB/PqqE/SkfB family radical SAM enzyme